MTATEIVKLIGNVELDLVLGVMLVFVGQAVAKAFKAVAAEPVTPKLPNINSLATAYPTPAEAPAVLLPVDVVSFCDEESEAWAQDECKSNARDKFNDQGDWNAVLVSLMRDAGVTK